MNTLLSVLLSSVHYRGWSEFDIYDADAADCFRRLVDISLRIGRRGWSSKPHGLLRARPPDGDRLHGIVTKQLTERLIEADRSLFSLDPFEERLRGLVGAQPRGHANLGSMYLDFYQPVFMADMFRIVYVMPRDDLSEWERRISTMLRATGTTEIRLVPQSILQQVQKDCADMAAYMSRR